MATHPILSLTWRRKLLFIVVTFLVFSSISTTVVFWPRSYLATSKVLLQIKNFNQNQGFFSSQLSTYINTQIDIVESSRVAGRVMELLRLTSNPSAVERYQQNQTNNQSIEQFYTQHLKNGLTVAQSKDGYILEISYRAADPTYAMQVANTFAKAYIEVNLDLNRVLLENSQASESQAIKAVLLDQASTPLGPASPKTLLGLVIAGLIAPLVGLIAVLFTEALDRRVRSRQDLEEATGTSVLCIVGIGRPSRTLAVFQTVFGFLLPRSEQGSL
jgi:uncharacterized protein involved in exopolysaccharide biosynthesis